MLSYSRRLARLPPAFQLDDADNYFTVLSIESNSISGYLLQAILIAFETK